VRRSAVIAALHVPGVEAVTLTLPAADVLPGPTQVAEVGAVTLTLAEPEGGA
jgi:phage-related baseplate assembly protein